MNKLSLQKEFKNKLLNVIKSIFADREQEEEIRSILKEYMSEEDIEIYIEKYRHA